MEEKQPKYKQRFYTIPFFTIILVLIILIILSFLLLYGLIESYSRGDRNLITLFPQNDDFHNSALITDYSMTKAHSDLTVQDEKNVIWQTHTDVDLFKSLYQNGNLVVQSDNGQKIIAPGTSNSYNFTIKNTGNISVNYKLELKSTFDLDNKLLPIEVRLYGNNRWICGDDTTWVSPFELSELTTETDMSVGSSIDYRLDWRWPVNSDLGNENDTNLGVTAADHDVYFKLEIYTSSEVEEGAVPVDKYGTKLSTKYITYLAFIGFPIILGIGIILIILWVRKKIFVSIIFDSPIISFKKPFFAKLTRKDESIFVDGRTMIANVTFGKKKNLIVKNEESQELAAIRFALKRTKDVDSIAFDTDDDGLLTILVGKKIRAIELFASVVGGEGIQSIVFNDSKAICIDKEHNVWLDKENKLPPDENNCNTTPYGLHVDNNNCFTVVPIKESDFLAI